jgi:glycosyltransferase involved in cell wall biosynthesis
MRFLLYSSIGEDSIAGLFGMPEYSYFFVLKGFQEVLAELGSVTIIRDPYFEVEAIYGDCVARGEECVFLSFTPPYNTLVGLKCPTISVFAWEYSNIPTESWGQDPRIDWRHVFASHGRAITLSSYTANAVREVMGKDFPVAAIPVPVWDHYFSAGRVPQYSPNKYSIDIPAAIIDSRSFDVSTFRSVNELYLSSPTAPDRVLHLDGVIFTTVFCPTDGRKNWLDLVTAFCFAFRDVEDATLILKMTHHDPKTFIGPMLSLFSQLSPFKCRIVAMNGFVDQESYKKLIAASDYYVNASHCEGLCLPLMEFMSYGKPVIAPCHTAMVDYIDKESALVVRAGLECNVWPHDPRDLFRTLRYRIDWGSLFDAYLEGYRIAREEPNTYANMSRHAAEKQRNHCSRAIVKKQLADFFNLPTGP